jgi:hypothetical protein
MIEVLSHCGQAGTESSRLADSSIKLEWPNIGIIGTAERNMKGARSLN